MSPGEEPETLKGARGAQGNGKGADLQPDLALMQGWEGEALVSLTLMRLPCGPAPSSLGTCWASQVTPQCAGEAERAFLDANAGVASAVNWVSLGRADRVLSGQLESRGRGTGCWARSAGGGGLGAVRSSGGGNRVLGKFSWGRDRVLSGQLERETGC